MFTQARTAGKTLDTRIEAFVLGMNETGLTAARCLGREGIAVKGFDIGAKCVGFRSRYCRASAICPDPLERPDDLLRFLRHQVRDRSEKVFLLPTSDVFFLFLLAIARSFCRPLPLSRA